jgi:superfamily II DNA or RNA helicase
VIKIEFHNRVIKVFDAPLAAQRAIDKATSYLVEGHFFAPSFKGGHWDGREKLAKLGRDCVETYSGLGWDVVAALKEGGFKFETINKTVKHHPRTYIWSANVVLRPYQDRVVASMLSTPLRGIGIAVMPIRSGKTKTAARCVHELGASALIIVPSKLLLHQTVETFRECFPHETIGQIGDGIFELESITVATIQTLQQLRTSKGNEKWSQIVDGFDILVVDEAHHARGGGDWHKVFTDINARYRLGFSATLFDDNNTEQGRGIIWARAACGRVRIKVETKELVDPGFLMAQNITMYNVNEPTKYRSAGWSQKISKACIQENATRNKIIAELCRDFAAEDRRVIVCVNRLNHIAALVNKLEDLGVDHRTITGSTDKERRKELIEDLTNGSYKILIGTVLREGVDIPAVDVVINGEGGRDIKNTIQRQRNLTISDGKREARFIDFFDNTNTTLRKHSRARLKSYRSESTTKVEVKDYAG